MFNSRLAISAMKIAEGYKCITREEKCEISANGIAKNGYSIAPLKETFTRLGYTYTQVVKNPDVVIYRVESKDDFYFEVFRYHTHALSPSFATMKKINQGFTHMEDYPGDHAFGSWAWCCRGLKAVKRLLATHFPGVDVDLSLLQKGGRA